METVLSTLLAGALLFDEKKISQSGEKAVFPTLFGRPQTVPPNIQ
jgi:hypothetical protein